MNIPPAVGDVLRAVAPTLALALGGPFGPLAATIASAALNAFLPGSPPPPAPGAPPPQVAPQEVVRAVQNNLHDPELVERLRQAEELLKDYERENKFNFAALEQKDRDSARTMSRDTGLARPQFLFGMGVVVLSLLMLFGIVTGCVMALTGTLSIDPAAAQIAIAAFGLIGTVVGVFQAVSAQILAFYFGSSAGSSAKTDQMTETMRDMGAALGDAAKSAPVRPVQPPVVVVPPTVPPVAPPPTAPADDLDWRQGPHGGVRWRLTEDGVVVEGDAKPLRTVGIPATARRVWQNYGRLIFDNCAKYGLPLEIAVACICTESRGRPDAVLVEPDGRASGGLFQMLTGTAAEVLGRSVSVEDLKDPALNIEAGVRFMAGKRQLTGFQPPLAAAAHNAGGLYKSDANRWKLRSTGDHIDRFCQFYGDACAVAKEDGWAAQVAVWSGGTPAPAAPQPAQGLVWSR